jgi:hypothetical protein
MEQGAQTADTPNENEELAKLRQAVTELTAERDTYVFASQYVCIMFSGGFDNAKSLYAHC